MTVAREAVTEFKFEPGESREKIHVEIFMNLSFIYSFLKHSSWLEVKAGEGANHS